MYNDETTVKHIENISFINSGAVISDGTLDECAQDILGGVNSINSEENNSSTTYSSVRRNLGKKTEGNPNGVNIEEDPRVTLSKIRRNNLSRVIIGHININHLAGKFENLTYLIKDKLDVLVITETKIDESYPTSQFIIEGLSPPFRLDRNKDGGGY